ncbi:MAG TPA: 7-cyano-7-deazaguanine synthase [Acidimicrobiales bacterium]|nr:7-cyano-7-deazaguanine synthase [Acidimicrobiales bacterium]
MATEGAVAVLASGGLDSAVLTAHLAGEGREVTPIYVRFGLAWEGVERRHLEAFLASLPSPCVNALILLDMPVADLYGTHWSVTGRDVPDEDSPDSAVYLPGRNLLLLAKASVWCALNGVPTIALGTLAANPFPDADDRFFAAFSALAARALGRPLEVLTPFAGRAKQEVLELGRPFALDLTFSCIAPRGEQHCGHCNKCAERRLAFDGRGLADATEYASS